MSDIRAFGVDVGSTTWKGVAIDGRGAIIHSHIEATHPRIEEQTERLLAKLRAATESDAPVGATGYGRKRVRAAKALTEITCHARGAFSLVNHAGVLIDMGGQDTKIIRIGDRGDVRDFSMNDKCAAGTGRFLEIILGRLQVPYDDVTAQVRGAQRPIAVSSTCTVFAESEVISLVAQGEPLGGILKGLHQSLAKRVSSLAGAIAPEARVYMSGGVALNATMVEALAAALDHPVSVLPSPQLVGALGAALSVWS